MEEKNHNLDLESGSKPGKGPKSISHWRLVIDQALVTPEVENWKYKGSGTDEDPYVSMQNTCLHLMDRLITSTGGGMD